MRSAHAASLRHCLIQNGLLASLPDDVQERLLPDLSFVKWSSGHILTKSHVCATHAFFLSAGVVSLMQEMPDGTSVQVAVVGSEGLVGLALFLGGESMPMPSVVQCAGYGLALSRDRLLEEFRRGGDFMHQLLRYSQALLIQIAQMAVCYRHHSIEQQLCRVLLMSLERTQGHEVPLTQEFVARQLGVRREGVTEAAGRLREAGLVMCRRGVFAVQDRFALEDRACRCLRLIKSEYQRLLSPCAFHAPAKPILPRASVSGECQLTDITG